MARYLLKRFTIMILTLWIIITGTFFLMHLAPGSPFNNEEKLTAEQKEQFKRIYGLDKPVYVQYAKYVGGILKGDLGKSLNMQPDTDVTKMIKDYFPATLTIGAQGLVWGICLGLLLGTLGALYRGRLLDNAVTVTSLMGVSFPSFILATLLSYYVGVKLNILPPALYDTYAHTILPSLALSFWPMAIVARYIRTELVDVLGLEYIKLAKAKGLSPRVVIFKHGLRNALIPVVTVLGTLIVTILTGSLAVETVFAVPGMGKLFYESIVGNDYFVIMGSTIFYGTLLVLARFLVDIIYSLIDPRIRLRGAKG